MKITEDMIAGALVGAVVYTIFKGPIDHTININATGVPGQQPVTFAQCVASGAPRACCVAAAAHHNPGINNPDPTCGMKGYYMNNCNNCGQPECSGGNTYPTGSVKPGQQGYSCGVGVA